MSCCGGGGDGGDNGGGAVGSFGNLMFNDKKLHEFMIRNYNMFS